MRQYKQTYFNLVEMINGTIKNQFFLEPNLPNKGPLKMNRKSLLLFILLCNSILFAQVPSISYSGVQSSYNINNPIATLTPISIGGLPAIRTTVSTTAGNGTSGYADGTIASPKYYSPTGVAVATSGNIYIADSQNHCIRKITAAGFVSTFAGTGVAGFANGASDVAQFNTPYSLAVDASENVYVTESNSYAVRKISAAGVVSTFAGNVITSGYLDGSATSALFASPKGLGVDTSGNVYVADATNNRIRKISSAGVVSTMAGDGTSGYLDGQGTAAKFSNPIGVAVAGSGVVYISDASNNRVRAISSTGAVTTIAGNASPGLVNGQGTAAQFNTPRAIAVDGSNNLYVVDYNNNCIRKITSTGLVSTLSGTGAFGAINGVGTVATFKYPEGITVDSSGNCYVADVTNNTIRKITSAGDTSIYSGTATRGLENGQGGTMAMFNSPVAVAVTTTGITYVIDDFNSCIRKVTSSGIVSTLAGNTATGYADGQGTMAYFNNPKGIVVDAAGNIYVADTYNNRIRKITSAGVVTTIAGDGTAGYLDGQGPTAKFNNPYSLTIDTSGNIYVADTKNNRIRKISSSGAVTTVAGYILSGYVDGASTVARFKNPQGITIDNATGILYVADTTNNRIRKIATDGTVSTLAGSFAGYTDDQGTAAYFNNPIGITIDASANLYVGDYYNSVIRKVTNTGLVSTYAGNGSSDYVDGIGNVASFYFPVGVTTDTSGNVYVADSYTQRIRKISSLDPYTITPVLPTGMIFNTTTGVLSGTPTEIRATTTYTIGASNYTGTGTTTISFATVNSTGTAAPTASAQTFCNAATVSNLVAIGTSLKWYNVATGGTALASTASLSTGNYYVSQTVNSIESSRTIVAVTINTTAAPMASAQSFCNSATVSNLVASGTSLQWYSVATGGTALTATTALATGNYYVSQTLNSCESSRTIVAVTINITAAPMASPQSFCNSATVSNLVANGTSLQWYSVATGGTALASTTSLSTGNYYVSQTFNSCESSRTIVAVTINTTAAPMASPQSFCNSATVSNLVANGTSLQWYSVATGGTALASTTSLSTGNYYVSQTFNSCESSRTIVAVTINITPAPTALAQTFNNSATVANLVATGMGLQWYSVANGGSALISTTSLSTGNYYVSQTLNSCESSRTLVSITINAAPGAPTASAQTFCNAATVSNLVATGTSLKWYNVATGGTALASNTSLLTGNYYVSQTVNSIESSRTTVAVTINTTAAPTASAQSFCNSATVSNLVASGTSLQWYAAVAGGTVLSSNTALTTGNYYVSQTLNSCESSRATIVASINITAVPTASAQTFNNSATVSNLVATGTGLQWYTVATGGMALASTTTLSTGNYYVSQTLNSCESLRTLVSVIINTAPGAPIASAQTFCNAATISNLVATGTLLQWYSVATGGTALASTTSLSTGNYYVSQTINSVESPRTAVVVTINVTAAPTASSQTFNNSATVANLVATGSALQWYTSTSGGTALPSTTSLATGNYYVSQTLNSCESFRTLVIVTINVAPTAPTATPQTFCNTATVANLVATGTALKWYNVATGGTALLSTAALGTGNYYVSQTVNSVESPRTTVFVTINITAAPTVSSQTFCSGATVANLVANGTALKWYTVTTGGTALASTTNLVTGNYYVTQTLNSCESPRTLSIITINVPPTAPTASAQAFCNGATVSNLNASGTSLKWYDIATGGTALGSTTVITTGNYYVTQTLNTCESVRTSVLVSVNTTVAPTASSQIFNNTATVANLVATGSALQWYASASGGTALLSTTALTSGNYYVSQTLNSCESSRTLVVVTLNIAPSAPIASAQTFCNSATVANLVATGNSLQWYSVSTGGTALSTTTPLVTGNYYVSQTLNSIESLRTTVTVTINTTVPPTASTQSYNSGATVANLIATGTSLQWYTVTTGGIALDSTTNLVTGNYYVTQTLNSCESARTLVIVTINSAPSPPVAAAQTFCNSATVSNLVATGTSLKWYTVLTGGTVLASTAALTSGNYYVSQTVNSIESSRSSVLVTINTTAAPTTTSQTFCNGATVASLIATGNSLKWYTATTGGTVLASTASLITGNYYVSQTVNTCESSRLLAIVTINITASPIAPSQTFNNGATVSNLVATGTSLKWYNLATGGTALAATTILATGNYYVSQTLNSCESTRTPVSVTINSVLSAPTAIAQSFCSASTVGSLVATGSSLKWYTVSTGGTALSSTANITTGNYYVSQTVNGVESTRTLVRVTVYAAPIAASISSPTYSGSVRTPICTSDAKVLNVKSGYSATSIQWEVAVTGLNSNAAPANSAYVKIDGATATSYTVTNATAGRNYFRVKFMNGTCSDTAVYSTFVVYYKNCSTAKLAVVSYPNPFSENFNLSLSTSSEEKILVTVYDMTGRLIEQRESSLNDISELKVGDRYPSGLYNVVVAQGEEVKTVRVIKR